MGYYDLPDERDEFIHIDEHQRVMTDLRDYFLGVIEEVYGIEQLNTQALDHCVEEICHILELHMPKRAPNIKRDRKVIQFIDTVDLVGIANIR